MKDLPKFKARRYDDVKAFVTQVLIHPDHPDESYFRQLTAFEDGHYRVTFSLAYFQKAESPTKSQWNTLKKKLKRHDKLIFVFKEHGFVAYDSGEACGYIEFGFFTHARE